MNQGLPKAGLALIKEFEGCSLSAYGDPITGAEPYTIGWGSTRDLEGKPFKLGDKITQDQADSLLEYQLLRAYLPGVRKIPHFNEMSEEQVGALLSFAYNLGAGFYGAPGFETISRRLKNKEWDLVPDALLLYRNPGSPAEAGLRRRRIAEGALWRKGLQKSKVQKLQIIALKPTILKKEPLQSYQLSYNNKKDVAKGKSYQVIDIVNEGIHSKVTLDYGAGLWYIYNPHWEVVPINGTVGDGVTSKILKVKYFPQRDSATAHANRMCMSSSCAMAADFLLPTAIQVAEQEDDYYLRNYVFKYGDTTDPNVQIKALNDLGIKAVFRKNLSHKDIIDQINKGIPVPIGILHHGHVSAPTGGGHWMCVIGYDNKTEEYIVHDPFGELSVIEGGYYGSTNGANQRYSYKGLNKRWMVEGEGRGYGIMISSW